MDRHQERKRAGGNEGRRGPGRPPKGDRALTARLHLRLTPADLSCLRSAAEGVDTTPGRLARALLMAALRRGGGPMDGPGDDPRTLNASAR